ncbi:NYN domain-containing protein [Aquabacterium sp. G14]|uniref:NYN domain-containing protein n=1 Tax=Aquabacterium sp. G14 TaxID=3130164 RepID=UPI0030B404B0
MSGTSVLKSALFVDFDNVYSGLRRLDVAYAEAFASDPLRWLNWVTTQLAMPLAPEAPVQRRILVRRCYLNPVMYQRFRFGFSKAGFEITDCPPMTSAGKTSTDIHMVLDMVDVLQSPTHYDEFIVFSADADFTPVLRKLRRDDRRTTIFAAGATSASYDASSDLIIDPDAFVSEALGFGDEEMTPTAPPDFESLLSQAEALIWSVMDKSSEPIMLPALTRILATQVPGLTDSRWAGRGTFTGFLRDLTLDPLRIDRENNWLYDPRRLRGAGATETPRNGRVDAPPSAPAATASSDTRAQIERLLVEAVASSARPVAVARLAHLVRQHIPGIDTDWLGHGTFKRLLETLHPPGVEISWSHLGGHALDLQRHSTDFLSQSAATAGDLPSRDPRWPQVAPMLQVANLPAMPGYKYRAVLQALSTALAEGPYALAHTSKRIHELCLDAHVSVSRPDIHALLRALLFNGFDPTTSATSFDDLVATTCGVALAACEREGMTISDADRAALLGWVVSEQNAP